MKTVFTNKEVQETSCRGSGDVPQIKPSPKTGGYRGLISAILTAILLASMLPALSCSGEWPGGKVGVAVTILPLADFVSQVGGDKVEVMVMVPPGRGPHDYAPTTGQMTQLSRADMYAKVGSGVEFELTWMDNLIEQNDDMHVADCSANVALLGSDPHIWLSPINAKTMVANICAGLIAVDPDNADFYTQNRDDYLAELDDLNDYIDQKLDGYTNRNFIIYHPSFGYFANDYGLTQIPIEHDGKEPTAQVMQNAISQAETHSLQYIYVAPQFNQEYAQTIAAQIGGSLLEVDPLPSDYIQSMHDVADAIALEME